MAREHDFERGNSANVASSSGRCSNKLVTTSCEHDTLWRHVCVCGMRNAVEVKKQRDHLSSAISEKRPPPLSGRVVQIRADYQFAG